MKGQFPAGACTKVSDRKAPVAALVQTGPQM